jgi:recombinational DNA repair ATPase RecF
MRIVKIELNNFRAFYGKHTINLDSDGKNLMVYGENGSGKSSLYLALKTFFQAAKVAQPMRELENIFVSEAQKNSASIQLTIKQSPNSSSKTEIDLTIAQNEIIGTDKILIANANKIKGFFDYKSLLKTHLVDTEHINMFDIIIKDILHEQENRFSNNTIGKEWNDIIYDSHELRQGPHVKARITNNIEKFNDGLTQQLQAIESDTNLFLQEFGYNMSVSLIFEGLRYHGRRDIKGNLIKVEITFFNKSIPKHQHFLNEARLSALAISLYLATVKTNPGVGVLKTLILDDLLIGLDMSNRLPLLEIIKNHFEEEYQIIMTTYDKVWYDLVKNYFDDSKWKYIDIYSRKLDNNDFEMPLIKQNTDFIEKAEHYVNIGDYKASAVYIRTEFEKLLHSFCDKKNLLVKYKTKSKELKSEDFWKAIKDQTNIDVTLVSELETCRGTVLNPFSHYNLETPEFEAELRKSIDIVKRLKTPSFIKDNSKTYAHMKNTISELEANISEKDNIISAMRVRLSE